MEIVVKVKCRTSFVTFCKTKIRKIIGGPITHEICKSFDACLDVTAVFLNISKGFDKVWHQDLLYKLKQNGISGNLLGTLTEFLKDQKQRVVLNGKKLLMGKY